MSTYSSLRATPVTNGQSAAQKRAACSGPHRSKRLRLNEDSYAAIETRCADESTSLEVHTMILDYLAYQATTACFASRRPQNKPNPHTSLAHNLSLVDTFFTLFRRRHSNYILDPELRFRLLLLKLTTLYTQRLTRNASTPFRSALKQLRESNQARARSWITTPSRFPSASHSTTTLNNPASFPTPTDLERNRAHVLHALDIPAEDEAYEDAYYGTSDSLSLLDLLPLFMQVSAARKAMSESYLTEAWMHMAAEFMLQAALEQYLVFGAQGSDAVDEAFAFGHKSAEAKGEGEEMEMDGQEPGSKEHEEDEHADEVNEMFTDPIHESEVPAWTAIKSSYLAELLPATTINSSTTSKSTYSVPSSSASSSTDRVKQPSLDPTSRLGMAAAKHPLPPFEASVLSFLGALSQSIPTPVLAQLESGQLEGMTKDETQAFDRSCGLSTARFYEGVAGFKGPVRTD